jgi:hypothetical protein
LLVDDRDRDHALAPAQGLVVGGEEDVELVALDRAAAVQDRDALPARVAGDLQPGVEVEEVFVRGDEESGVVIDALAAGGDAAGVGGRSISCTGNRRSLPS